MLRGGLLTQPEADPKTGELITKSEHIVAVYADASTTTSAPPPSAPPPSAPPPTGGALFGEAPKPGKVFRQSTAVGGTLGDGPSPFAVPGRKSLLPPMSKPLAPGKEAAFASVYKSSTMELRMVDRAV